MEYFVIYSLVYKLRLEVSQISRFSSRHWGDFANQMNNFFLYSELDDSLRINSDTRSHLCHHVRAKTSSYSAISARKNQYNFVAHIFFAVLLLFYCAYILTDRSFVTDVIYH